MGKIFLTSDWHVLHKRICEHAGRPFSSLDEMHQTLIDNYNSVVGEDDTCYFLGDLLIGNFDAAMEVYRQLNGWRIVVFGNHDDGWSGNGSKKHDRYIDAGFSIAPEDVLLEYKNLNVRLSHFPYDASERHGSRYNEYHPVRGERGEDVLLHGHTHQKISINGDCYHVGVDSNNFMPVRLEDIITEMGL